MAYYPFNGKDNESEIILYEDRHFWVSFGFDKTEKHYRVGLMWKEVKNECQAYPIGRDGQPQWFRIGYNLAIDFLQMLKNKQPKDNMTINKNEIDKAIKELITQAQTCKRDSQ